VSFLGAAEAAEPPQGLSVYSLLQSYFEVYVFLGQGVFIHLLVPRSSLHSPCKLLWYPLEAGHKQSFKKQTKKIVSKNNAGQKV